MPWTESTSELSANKLVAISAQDALRMSGFQPFLTLIDANANGMQSRIQNADGKLVFYVQSGLNAASPTVVFNTLGAPAGQPLPSAVEIHAQDGVQTVGFQPFLTLTDANAGFARSRIQNADGKLVFYVQSGLDAGSPTVVFNTLRAADGQPLPSAIEIHAQEGVQVVGFEPFITLSDANSGFAQARIQNANGDIVFYAQGGITSKTPAMIVESATGNVHVTGALTADKDIILTGADLAENFETADPMLADPGTVMVLDGVDQVRVSDCAYDRKVVGVVSGAGAYRPGVVLDHKANVRTRRALALVGKTFCKIDASFGPIEVGDLLTTSPTPGHAMKASEPNRAFGAVLGKAMAGLSEGCGLLPILVTLQ